MDPAVQEYFQLHRLPLPSAFLYQPAEEDLLYIHQPADSRRSSLDSDSSLIVEAEPQRPFALRTFSPSSAPASQMEAPSPRRGHHRRSGAISIKTSDSAVAFFASHSAPCSTAGSSLSAMDFDEPSRPRKIKFWDSEAVPPHRPSTSSSTSHDSNGTLKSILRNSTASSTFQLKIESPSPPSTVTTAHKSQTRPGLGSRHYSTTSTCSTLSDASSANTSLLYDELPTPTFPDETAKSIPRTPQLLVVDGDATIEDVEMALADSRLAEDKAPWRLDG